MGLADPPSTLLFAAAGVLIAAISSMAGIGGGVFMVPLLYSIGYPLNVAIGTSKFVIVFISSSSALSYSRAGKVDKALGLVLMASMAPGGYLGAITVSRANTRILEVMVGLLIVYYSLRLLVRGFREYLSERTNSTGLERQEKRHKSPHRSPKTLALSAMAGFAIGLVAGLTGTGGGALLVPFMVSILGMRIHEAVATSMYSMLLAAITAAIGHYQNNDINLAAGLPLTLGALAGAFVGSRTAVKLSPWALRLVVGAVLIVIGLRLIV